ncbi:MAG TPA: HlyD family secretion protein, partial [Bradyrhizobium sp.]|nr:HlyD family secretion protein [Bradyrhizobium sp.]
MMLAPSEDASITRRLQRRRRFMVMGAVFFVGAVVAGVMWFVSRNHETTDDAYIDGDIVQVASQVPGMVAVVHFTDNQLVTKGTLLIEIDARDYEVAAASARATRDVAMAQEQAAAAAVDFTRTTTGAGLAQAAGGLEQMRKMVNQARSQSEALRADAVRAAADAQRVQDLYQSQHVSKQRLDQAVADASASQARWQAAEATTAATEAQVAQALAKLAEAGGGPQQIAVKEAELAGAKAQVEQAAAALRTAELNLSYTKIFAPQDGRLTRKAAAVGNFAQRGQTLTSLVAYPPWIWANFKETQLARMRAGMPVGIKVDANPGRSFRGHVDSIQAGTGARFSLLPPENATG